MHASVETWSFSPTRGPGAQDFKILGALGAGGGHFDKTLGHNLWLGGGATGSITIWYICFLWLCAQPVYGRWCAHNIVSLHPARQCH